MGIGNSEQKLVRPILTQVARAVAVLCIAALCLAMPALAGWREDIGTFRVGIVAEPGAGNTIAGLAALNEAYSKALGLKVEFFVARSYAALSTPKPRRASNTRSTAHRPTPRPISGANA